MSYGSNSNEVRKALTAKLTSKGKKSLDNVDDEVKEVIGLLIDSIAEMLPEYVDNALNNVAKKANQLQQF